MLWTECFRFGLFTHTNRRFWQSERYVALKIGMRKSAYTDGNDNSKHEEKLHTRIAEANPSHGGYTIVRRLHDVFTVANGDEEHSCAVYELMREPLNEFRWRLKDERIPLHLFKLYMIILLEALDYLHSECHIIHTGVFVQSDLVSVFLIFGKISRRLIS